MDLTWTSQLVIAGAAGSVSALAAPALARSLPSRQPADRFTLARWSVLQRLALCGAEAIAVGLTMAAAPALSTSAYATRLVAVCAVATVLVAISAVDLRTHRLPDRLTQTLAALVAAVVVAISATGTPLAVLGAMIGGASFVAVIGGMRYIAPGSMGLGDVKLVAVLGALLGAVAAGPFRALPAVLVALFLASVMSIAVGFTLSWISTGARPQALPFGPGLVAGSWLAGTLVIAAG